jgi:cytoskeletal protein RodZ
METNDKTQPIPTQPEKVSAKPNRGWSLISMLAAFVIGWAVALAVLQYRQWVPRAKPVADAVKPAVNAVQRAVDTAKKATEPAAVPQELAKPATDSRAITPALQSEPVQTSSNVTAKVSPETEKPVMTDKPAIVEKSAAVEGPVVAAAAESSTDERVAIRKMFERNIETVRILTGR